MFSKSVDGLAMNAKEQAEFHRLLSLVAHHLEGLVTGEAAVG